MFGVINMCSNAIINLKYPSGSKGAFPKAYMDSENAKQDLAIKTKLPKDGSESMEGNVNINNSVKQELRRPN